jgi:hypothetical protein
MRNNERGMVSITVTVILMLVITITVLSFAQIIRREQRQALDNQLSSQAFYAAESGINQVRKYIEATYLASGQTPPDKTRCSNKNPDNPDYPPAALPMEIGTNTGVSFSCILVGGSPKSLKYDLSSSSGSKVFPIDAGARVIDQVVISWTPSTKDAPRTGCSNTTSASATLPTATAWPCKGYGIIRIDLVPANSTDRADIMADMFTAFLTPANITGGREVTYSGSGSNINGGNANQGARPVASCTDDNCTITIKNMSIATNNATKYYARVSTLYRDTSLTVVAKDSTNADLNLIGAQVMLDATGRAQDVLRRVQVRIPLVGDSFHPDYGVQTTESMCKQFTTYPGFSNSTLGC